MGSVNFDRANEMELALALQAAVYTTAQTGVAVDCRMANGQYAKTVTFIVNAGTFTDGTITFTYEEDDNSSFTSATAIPASRVFGTAMSITTSNDVATYCVTVKPNERYVRINTVETVASAGYTLGITALKEAS